MSINKISIEEFRLKFKEKSVDRFLGSIYRIPTLGSPDAIYGASYYFALLAYPDDDEKVERFMHAMNTCILRSNPKNLLKEDEWRRFAPLPKREMQRALHAAEKIIFRKRRAAGDMFIKLLRGQKPSESLTDMCSEYAKLYREVGLGHKDAVPVTLKRKISKSAANHFYESAWVSSRRVLHLCAGFFLVYGTYEIQDKYPSIGEMVANPHDWLHVAVDLANHFLADWAGLDSEAINRGLKNIEILDRVFIYPSDDTPPRQEWWVGDVQILPPQTETEQEIDQF